jgi:hypothetical protein
VASLKAKGDLAEVIVAADLVRRGYKVAIPYGEDWDYDLIVCRGLALERMQVKYTHSNGEVMVVRCNSHSLTNGKIRATKLYTPEMIDWLAIYDASSDRCYYIPAAELGEGRYVLHVRLRWPTSNRRKDIHHASDYLQF